MVRGLMIEDLIVAHCAPGISSLARREIAT
jgi:hypothetical protein